MAQGFGQFCPIALASEVLTLRWTPLILRELMAGSTRFNQIRRGVPRISATLLKSRLDALERAGIVVKREAPDRDGLDYCLTEAGRELKPILNGIGEWGQRWARDIRTDDLDPGWLVWSMHRGLNTAVMPSGRTVIQIEFTDAHRENRYFWLVCEDGAVEVCLKRPGFDVDLTVRSTVRAMAEVWRGIRPLKDELAAGSIELEGRAKHRRAFPSWLLLSRFAPIRRQYTR